MPKMNFGQYAKHRGVSAAAVTYAVKEGRISFHIDSVTGKRYVESEEADKQWAERTGARKNKDSDSWAAGFPDSKPSDPPPQSEVSNDEELDDDDEADPEEGSARPPNIYISKAEKEHYLAKQAKLSYEIKAGKLVEVEKVRAEWAKIALTIRNSIMTIPDRLAPALAGQTDADKIHELLTQEFIQALEALSDDGRSGKG